MDEIRGLAWDDKPEEYMVRLQRRLKPLNIGLEVEEDHGRFLDRFDSEVFDFALLDLFDDSGSLPSEKGTKLAQHITDAMRDKPWYPTFVITGYLERLNSDHFDKLPAGALLRYKADPVFIARLIQEDLRRRGVLVSRRKYSSFGRRQILLPMRWKIGCLDHNEEFRSIRSSPLIRQQSC